MDGSIKWLLLDFQIDLLPSETKAFVLKENAEIRNLDDISSVTLVDDGCTVTIHTGPLKFKLSRDRLTIIAPAGSLCP